MSREPGGLKDTDKRKEQGTAYVWGGEGTSHPINSIWGQEEERCPQRVAENGVAGTGQASPEQGEQEQNQGV